MSPRKRRRPKVWILSIFILLWSGLLGLGLTQTQAIGMQQVTRIAQASPPAIVAPNSTVDAVPQNLQLAQQLYLTNCSSCHIAVPPAVLPTQTWQQLLLDSNHYGATLELPLQPERSYIWNYLQTYSRSLNPEEEIPYRVQRSRYFKILHPRVDLPSNLNLNSCSSCHPGAAQFNFRGLTADWQNAS